MGGDVRAGGGVGLQGVGGAPGAAGAAGGLTKIVLARRSEVLFRGDLNPLALLAALQVCVPSPPPISSIQPLLRGRKMQEHGCIANADSCTSHLRPALGTAAAASPWGNKRSAAHRAGPLARPRAC